LSFPLFYFTKKLKEGRDENKTAPDNKRRTAKENGCIKPKTNLKIKNQKGEIKND